MRAAIYARISRDNDGQELGVSRQSEDCVREVQRRGWTVAGTYVDNDLSAYSGKARPEYRRMLEDVKAGTVGAVVAWHPDRLHRSVRELEDFIDLIAQTGAAVATCTAGDYDLSTPDGRFTARILGSVARKESDDKSRRAQRKHLELAEGGKVSGGGTRPFGFEADRRTLRPDEARLVQEALGRVLAGESVRGVASDWTARGVQTVTGRPWTSPVLRRLLVSARIAGLREHLGAVTAEAEWPAIVERGAWERARSILLDPGRRTNGGPGTARRYLLTGFALCGLCGAKLIARPRQDRRRCYVCATGPGFHGCGKIRVLAEPLEDLVRDMLFIALDSPALGEALAPAADDAEEGLRRALREDENALGLLARDFYAERRITRSEFMAARGPLEARIEDAKHQLADRARREGMFTELTVGIEAVADAWNERSLDWRRAVVHAVIADVQVGPAVKGRNRFDPERVGITWRA